jgi:hypothetical protein
MVETVETKTCKECLHDKPITEFYKFGAKTKTGFQYSTYCKSCQTIRARRYSENPDVRHRIRERALLRNYGLTYVEYQALLELQDNRCAICENEFSDTPHVDHDHTSGKVRGLLCDHCNRMLGYARDNVSTLMNAIRYIEENKNG